jgi:spore coat protein U-like protein
MNRSMRSPVSASLALIALLAVQGTAMGNDCSIGTQPIGFGLYDPLQATPLVALGGVSVDCGAGGGRPDLRIELSTGSSGTYVTRTLRNGGSVLAYNLFTDGTYTVVWGDGSGGSQPVLTRANPPGQGPLTVPIHARLPAGQDSGAGTHADTIVVTVIF